MNDRIGEHLKVQRSALNILVQRQEMIASNIANADTPHYKARDIDFKEALASRLAGRSEQNLGLALTSRRHIAGAAEATTPAALKYRRPPWRRSQVPDRVPAECGWQYGEYGCRARGLCRNRAAT